MSDPRILITTYHSAFLVRGGGEYEIFSVADSLKQRGLIVDIYGPYSRSMEHYDVVLHFSVHGDGLHLLERVKASGKPVALWPNLWAREMNDVSTDIINRHVGLANSVIFKSVSEQQHFSERFYLPPEKVRRITAGADMSYLQSAPAGLFKSLYGIERYAIWFGVIEPNKNQLAAVRVLKAKGIQLVLVGQGREEGYIQECRVAADGGVLFIKSLPQKSEIVRSALQEALFYIEMSHEPPGLSAIEAGLSGCRLLLSASEWSHEHFGDLATYADPNNDEDIARAVDVVLAMPKDDQRLAAELKRFCLPAAIDPLVDLLKEISR